ncbi:enoyl-CoA hydratase/isomerase family protein [Methylocystis sp. FS]|uniref:enoyl-CoA hydratase-related protein n=1 Tax=Methylocystis silviterrae TaxID=2743612 RepID=UPI0015825851|nr:enoyl-CoA hydratase-related protein [Methylocystis silviterrae]NUJ80783.1 enoyl-CoA hydratase/isomerase family protein [Methylocystis silviterrae]
MSEKIIVSRDHGVLRLLMNRPEKKNALDRKMYRALIVALEAAARDETVRAVVFAGAGGNFTAGNDLADFRDFAPGRDIAPSAEIFPALTFIRAAAAFEKPLVAAVTGDAVGVGTTLLFHCDLVYASSGARFTMPFIDLALPPEGGASLLVPQRFGMAKASQYLLLGESFDGAEALRLGLVNALAPPEEVLDLAMDAARRLAAKPSQALFAARRLMRGEPNDILSRIDTEAALFAKALTSPEARERFAAFFASRAR